MRLIDADKLLKDIEQYHLSDGFFQHWVEVQPTVEPEIVITPEEFKELMAHMAEINNEEARHYRMDYCMVELLNQLGYEEGTKIFKNTDKWYA